jgi:hypothetical protein
MLTEKEIRDMSVRRTRAVLPAMTFAILSVFLYLALMGYVRERLTSLAMDRLGGLARDITPIALILPAFAIFLLPSLLAARYAECFKTVCPSCGKDILSRTGRVLLTRCCPACSEQILGGRTHSAAVYERHLEIRSRYFLRYWLWAWPALGGLVIAWELLDRGAFRQCPQCLWITPLIGISTAGWAWLRTSDRRYLAQLLTSVTLLGLGAAVYCRTL